MVGLAESGKSRVIQSGVANGELTGSVHKKTLKRV